MTLSVVVAVLVLAGTLLACALTGWWMASTPEAKRRFESRARAGLAITESRMRCSACRTPFPLRGDPLAACRLCGAKAFRT